MRPWLQYTLARLGVFAIVLVILLLLGIEGWLAAIFATVIALCVSFLAFGRLRQRVADDIEDRRRGTAAPTLAETDAEAEDAEIESTRIESTSTESEPVESEPVESEPVESAPAEPGADPR